MWAVSVERNIALCLPFSSLDTECLHLKSAESKETARMIISRKKKNVSQDDLLDMKVAGNF